MLVCILNKEIGTERLIGNLFSVWVKISTNHPVILLLSFSLCISDIKLQKKGFNDIDLFPLLGVRRGRWHALGPLPEQSLSSQVAFWGMKECSAQNKALLWNLMGFHLLLPLIFAVFYHLPLHYIKRGKGGEQGWACTEISLLET